MKGEKGMKYTYIDKIYNVLGEVMGYFLEEENGEIEHFTNEEVKDLINQGHEFTNLCLNESGEIVDNREIDHFFWYNTETQRGEMDGETIHFEDEADIMNSLKEVIKSNESNEPIYVIVVVFNEGRDYRGAYSTDKNICHVSVLDIDTDYNVYAFEMVGNSERDLKTENRLFVIKFKDNK